VPKAAVRRLCKLETRFGVTAVRKSSVLSPEDAVIQMLAAGDWQCALELLEQGEGDLRHQRELIENWRASKNGLIDLDLTDRTQLHRLF
jgi:hypothetical protein